MVRLGDVCEILSGFAFDSSKFTENSKDVPLIRIRDIMRGFTTTYYSGNYDSKYLVKDGDYLIGMDGEFNISEWKGQDALLNQRVCKIICKSNILYHRYLIFFMPKALKNIENRTSFVTVKHLSTKSINQIQIPLPPIEVQKKIAQTLDVATELIALRKKQLAELDKLIKSTFYDMFGDPMTNEKEWEVKKLGEVGELARGISKHRPRNDPKLLNGVYPLIQTGDVANAGLYINNYKQTYSEIGLQQSKMWNKGTLCITIAANIAKTAILKFSACFPDSIVGFKPNEFTNVFYINVWFSFFQRIIEEQAPESAQKNINLKILNDLDIVIPPLALQNQFAEIVTKIEEQKYLVQKAIDESQYLFDSLMSEYFE
ncbi:restriction endonuclease subunit S [bacterium BFN5]|nr:restriction endonuclease subunit S [bacterium BFN5]QJW49051.1 restriction endonuclease subunit S [bacterium BFN5]